ncbi:MAG: signal peptidase II [Candidatus Peribacteraceae bacterium]|nr:signal peptidase II [Candidatus Peribacteraceae bacterium]
MWLLLTSAIVSGLLGVLAAVFVDAFLAQRIAIVGAFIGFERSVNGGVAFGWHLGIIQPLLIAVALILIAWLATVAAKTREAQIGFGLIIGGGIANIIDRLRDGFVTDFIQVGSCPVFNLADSCITAGAVLLLLGYLQKQK